MANVVQLVLVANLGSTSLRMVEEEAPILQTFHLWKCEFFGKKLKFNGEIL
jgi:hypothetical protein